MRLLEQYDAVEGQMGGEVVHAQNEHAAQVETELHD